MMAQRVSITCLAAQWPQLMLSMVTRHVSPSHCFNLRVPTFGNSTPDQKALFLEEAKVIDTEELYAVSSRRLY
jgi:hypothetical protein